MQKQIKTHSDLKDCHFCSSKGKKILILKVMAYVPPHRDLEQAGRQVGKQAGSQSAIGTRLGVIRTALWMSVSG